MNTEQLAQFYIYIDDIIAKSAKGVIEWRQVNPTTFIYINSEKNARLLIQQVQQATAGGTPSVYAFEAQDGQGKTKLEVSGHMGSNTNRKLSELFYSITKYKDAKGLDFLKSIIP